MFSMLSRNFHCSRFTQSTSLVIIGDTGVVSSLGAIYLVPTTGPGADDNKLRLGKISEHGYIRADDSQIHEPYETW